MIEYDCQFRIHLPNAHLTLLLKIFTVLLPQILADFIQKALIGYGELLMARSSKPFCCDKCQNDRRFKWKIRNGKPTKVLPTFRVSAKFMATFGTVIDKMTLWKLVQS